jgi:hypothetical protein
VSRLAAGPGRAVRSPVVLVTAVAVLPIVVAIVRSISSDWMPIGDNALVEMRSRDVFTIAHFPWLGTWSSASLTAGTDLNHPVPLLFDLLALPVRLFGGPAGVALGVGLVNIAAVVLAVLAALRAGGRTAGVLAGATAAALSWTMGSALLTDPWNPHVLILPCLAMLMLAWTVASGQLGWLPWMLAVASLCLQTHLGYAYLVPATCLVAIGGAAVVFRRRWRLDAGIRAEDVRSIRRTGAWSVGVLLVLWLQPLVEQFTGTGKGNLARILSSTGGDQPKVGGSLGVRLFASVVALPPWWGRSSFTTSVPDTPFEPDGVTVDPAGVPRIAIAVVALLVLAGLLGLAGWWAWRRRDRPLTVAVVLAGVLAVIALGTLYLMPIGVLGLTAHQMRWLWPIGAFTAFVLLFALARRFPSAPVWTGIGAGLTGLFVLLNLPAHVQPAGPERDVTAQPVARSLSAQMAAFEPDGDVLFDVSNLRFAESYSTVVMSAMQRDGIDFFVTEEGMVRQLGEARRADGSETVRVMVLEGRAALDPPVDGERVAFASPLSPAEIDELLALEQDEVAELERVGTPLTPAGEALIDAGTLGVDSAGFAAMTPHELVDAGIIAGLVASDGLDLGLLDAATFTRATELRLRVTTTTASVVATPITTG